MKNTWKIYQEELTISEICNPLELKDKYNQIKIKRVDLKNDMVFLIQNLKEEVLSGTIKQQKQKIKQLKKIFKQYLKMFLKIGISAGIITMIFHPLITSAQTTTSFSMLTNSTPNVDITPSTIMKWGTTIALLIIAVGASLSMILFGVVGIYLMITKDRKTTIEWNSNIVKGLVQTLVAIPLVYAIFHLAMLVFKNLPFLNNFLGN